MPPPDSPADRRKLGLGAIIVLVIAALAVTVVIGIVRSASAPVESVTIDESAAPGAVTTEEIYVHVSGAVAVPGLYVLPGDARVVDAVSAAGGFAPEADPAAVNLARPLVDGEQLVVGLQGEQSDGEPAAVDDGLVDLNTADAAALDTLPRIGPAMAERILQWREQNGRFTSVDDLLAVPGIGDKMFQALRDLVKV